MFPCAIITSYYYCFYVVQINYWDQEVKLTDPKFAELRSSDEAVSSIWKDVMTDDALARVLPSMGDKLFADTTETYKKELTAWSRKRAAYDEHVAAENSRLAAEAARLAPGVGGRFVNLEGGALELMKAYMLHDSKTDKTMQSFARQMTHMVKKFDLIPDKHTHKDDKEDMEEIVEDAVESAVDQAVDRAVDRRMNEMKAALKVTVGSSVERAISTHLRKASKESADHRAACVEIERQFKDLARAVPEATTVWPTATKGIIKQAIVALSAILNSDFVDKCEELFKAPTGEKIDLVEIPEEDDDDGLGDGKDDGVLGVENVDHPDLEDEEEHDGDQHAGGEILGTAPVNPATQPAVAEVTTGDNPALQPAATPGGLPAVHLLSLPQTATEGNVSSQRSQRPRRGAVDAAGLAHGRAPSPNPTEGSQVVIESFYDESQDFPFSQFGTQLEEDGSQFEDGGMPTPLAQHASIEQRNTRAAQRAAFNTLEPTQPQPSPY